MMLAYRLAALEDPLTALDEDDQRWAQIVEEIEEESRFDHCLPSTAHHEAGHAVACRILGVTLDKVSVIPTTRRLGFAAHDDGHLPERQQAMILLAGIVAEQLFLQGHPCPQMLGQPDVAEAMRLLALASGLVFLVGEIHEAARGVERELMELFASNHRPCYWLAVTALADALLKRGELRGGVAEAIIDAALQEEPLDHPAQPTQPQANRVPAVCPPPASFGFTR